MGCISNKDLLNSLNDIEKKDVEICVRTEQLVNNYNVVVDTCNELKTINSEILNLVQLTVSPRKKET